MKLRKKIFERKKDDRNKNGFWRWMLGLCNTIPTPIPNNLKGKHNPLIKYTSGMKKNCFSLILPYHMPVLFTKFHRFV